jgi:hypothetical protein
VQGHFLPLSVHHVEKSTTHRSQVTEVCIFIYSDCHFWGTDNLYVKETHEKCITKFWPENVEGRDHSEDLGVDGKIILEWALEK